jgi:Rha family phage regulatory protein
MNDLTTFSNPEFGQVRTVEINGTPWLFFKTEYVHPQNHQKYPMYLMNRDGFSLLAMGFTGKEAAQ